MAEDPCSFYTCNTKTGVCSASGFLGEISCDDANTCTFNDTCELDDFNYASCKGTPFPTDDGNSCTDDACLDGVVTHTKVDGLPCVPDDLCSPTGLCEEGLCVAATPCECSKDADCPQSEDACVGNKLCNAETGTCEIDPSSVIQCEPSPLPCHTNECLPGFGSCIELTSPNGTPCSDGNACTAFDACDGGACVGSEVLDCDDGMFCNGQETCDSNDGCQAGVAPIIDDGVACTVDSCDDLADVVIHQPDQLQCDDGVFCNGAELCDLTLGCKGPDAPFVDDGFECTTDFCDEATKTVGHIPDQAVCDTNNPCKVDACILGVGCESTPIADCCGNELFDAGEECDDGNDVSFDGCSSTCVDECMYTSAGTVSDEHKLSATQGNFYGSLGDGDLFGWAVANPADMDGDGVQDLVIGMRLDDDGGASTGAIWIAYLNHDGTTKGQQKISDLKGGFNGDLDPGDNFGSAVASIGDLNGDGIVDLAVGAMDDDDGGPARGAVWILFMKADGTVKGHQKISMEHGLFEGQLEDGDAFGRAISVVGDLDGDGYVELAVGSPGCDDGGKDAGAVWILFLTAGGKVKHEQRISDAQGGFTGGIAKQDLFGSAVAAIGDSDGDGVFDLAVGAPFDNDGGWDVGSVWILYLNADGTVKNHQKIGLNLGGFTGDIADDGYFGDALTSLGDLDANGFPDLAVGASGEDDGGTDKGAVWILYMGPGGTVIAEEKIGVVSGGLTANLDDGDFFGGSLAALGKTDGTMRPRLLVGAWGDDDGGLDKGAVYILDLIYQCSVCGNGELEAWEICDDGNIQNGDGCPSDCVP
jgi:cysteine-rich repeat protein